MKILITEPEYYPREYIKPLEGIAKVVAKRMTYDELLGEVRDVDALVVRVETKVDKKVLDNAENLKVIASMTTGLDHIDLKEAEVRGIKIVSLPGYATIATAEYTMSLILSLTRKVPWAFDHMKKEKWERHKFIGAELSGKTIGIIGFGRIGSQVARYANAFGMDVIFFDPYLDKNMLKDVGASQVFSLDDILQKSDVISIHAFLSKETEKMIRREQLEKMKKSAFLINASRGMIVDESDLVEALKDGKIAGAALDTYEEEPLPPSHELVDYARSHENLILTPHIAGSTNESIENAAKFVVGRLLELLK
jgi:D-3-phosphoglycerate dehydrogenase